jgi:hypothetical protein
MHKPLMTLATIAAVLGALAAPAGAGAADGGTAVTSSGLAAFGWADKFTVTFVVPSGPTTGRTTIPGVDLGKPWASLYVLGSGSDLSGIGGTMGCSTVVANPSGYSAGHPALPARQGEIVPVSGIYFDASCDDGGGYDFYRVRWDDTSTDGEPWRCFESIFPVAAGAFYWGSGVQHGGYHGTLSPLVYNGCDEAAILTVYGHDALGFHLVSGGGAGQVAPHASNIVTTFAGN